MPSIDIAESDRRKQYNAAAGQTDFVTDFPCFSADDVKAIVDGVDVTAFTVSGLNTESGFTVVFDTPMVGGEVVTIYSQTVIARGSQYQVGGRFDAPPLERDLDKITTILQEQKRNIDQTVAFGQDVLGVSGSIGAPVDGSVLMFSGTGGAIVAGPTGTEVANAQGYATAAGVSQTNAAASASAASASAAAAAASAAEGMWNNVESLVFGDSPYVPDGIEEGTLFRCDCTGGDIVINLSTLATYAEDMKFGFVKIDASANKITINRGGTDTINGATSLDITKQWQPHALIGDLESGSWIDTVQASATTASDISADNTGNTYLTAITVQGQLDQVEEELGTSNGANELVRLDGSGKLPANLSNQLLHIVDQKSQGTAGGGSSAGVNTRTLNTIIGTNEITGSSLSSNQITLPAGTYEITFSAPAHKPIGHKAYLYNVTDSDVLAVGKSEYNANTTFYCTTQSEGFIKTELAGTKVIELRHYIGSAQATNGLGVATDATGLVERYSEVIIRKL